MKLASGICGGVLVKVLTVYKKCISERYNKNFMAPRGNKITQYQIQIEKHVLFCWSSGPGQPAGYQHVGLKSFPMHISQSSRSLTDIRIFSFLKFFTFQWLKSHQDWWHSDGPLHLQE